MQGNRRRDTSPELAVRRLVHAAGLRYRVDAKPVSTVNRRADLVFSRARVAVFLDGCFWHGCPRHLRLPAANAEYWSSKIEGNVRRDHETDEQLRERGWTVRRFWEHEDPTHVASEIVAAVRASRSSFPANPRQGPTDFTAEANH
ncbi:very short patch repair endonuclease [Mycolicibacterium gilvum]|uniref:very short patch repair endonuclease n=1 Tax=Mycolicibacterium gilvum TaxID=1804 RepID=UPI000E1BF3FD|nr:very short patch repair endonuclease [Mycolicibacterium gilvum]MCV7057759.1 DNA mismatch endonuclease Vsr [Mycolicibacterium gilvum]